MINIILITLILHTLGVLIWKPKLNTLNCGIFVWAGKNPKKFNETKLNVLGIHNEVRGVHSCGISRDGEISIGVDDNKIYRDFLANTGYTNPVKFPHVIGHTRQSTFGAHNIDNAHPFGFGSLGDGYEFIGAHNGTLVNHNFLAEKYKIEKTCEIKSEDKYAKRYRTKIDSEILLEIIYKTKDFKVLSEYNGAAALVFVNLNEPNIMYCYRGESKKRDFINSEVAEERPLYYYQETKNSLYISSIVSSLLTIGAKGENWGVFDTNTVYKITDGNVATAEKFVITRKDRFQTGYDNGSYNDYYNNRNQCGLHGPRNSKAADWADKKNREVNTAHTKAEEARRTDLLSYNLFNEAPTQNVNFYKSRIYFSKLRHWRNGHLIDGCYTYIDGYGFYFLDNSPKKAEELFYDNVNKMFFNGEFMAPDKVPAKHVGAAFMPFVHKTKKEITNFPFFYFYKGIRIRTKNDYLVCVSMEEKHEYPFQFTQLSHCAAHPILDITKRFIAYDDQEILFDGVNVTDTICPLGSERVYVIENGNCVDFSDIGDVQRKENVKTNRESIEDNSGGQSTLFKLEEDLKEIERSFSIGDEENKDMEQFNKSFEQESEEDVINYDLLDEEIDNMFKEGLRKYPTYVKRLLEYDGSDRAKVAVNIFDKFIKTATRLMAIEVKE